MGRLDGKTVVVIGGAQGIGRGCVLGRPGDPELDIGAGVAFLLSDDARYVTGQTIALDGGGLAL